MLTGVAATFMEELQKAEIEGMVAGFYVFIG
jgi:hypothetical protein